MLRKNCKISIRAPLVICLAMLADLAFALGHHFFFESLDGIELDAAVLDQQYNNGIGYALAFLMRACLVFAVGTAYWQVFWGTLIRKRLTINNVGTLHSLLGNVFSFGEVKAIYRHPTLVFLALLPWCLPLVAIITSATLSVFNTPKPSNASMAVSLPFFSADTMANTLEASSGLRMTGTSVLYSGPSRLLSQLSLGTAIQGVMPPIQAPYLNSSYETTFDGPRLQCQNTTDPTLLAFLVRMIGWYGRGSQMSNADRPYHWYTYQYVSWAPTSTELVPWDINSIEISELIGFNTSSTVYGLSTFVGQYQNTTPSIFVATRRTDEGMPIRDAMWKWDVLNCSFYDSTYTINYNFTNGASNANILSIKNSDQPITVRAMSNTPGRIKH